MALLSAGSALAGAWSVLTSARYSRLSTAKEPSSHTGVAPAVRYPTRGGRGHGYLKQGREGDRGDQQQPRQPQLGMARSPARAAVTMAP